MSEKDKSQPDSAGADRSAGWRQLYSTDDWWAVWLGSFLLFAAWVIVTVSGAGDGTTANPLSSLFAKPGSWSANPLEAFQAKGKSIVPGLLGGFTVCLILFAIGKKCMGAPLPRFLAGFCLLFLLALIAYVLAGQEVVKSYNLEYALWALAVGLMISNTIGTPKFLQSAACTEFYIKTGLVLLGGEVLVSRLLALGIPGVCVAWVVTPIVIMAVSVLA